MRTEIELLAPGGDMDSIKSAILAGADAVYCGLNKFNARNRAENIVFDDLNGILRFAHKNNCKVFLTLNILIVESEIPDLIRLLNKLNNTSIDGVIIQDLGLFYILSKYFAGLKIHASTQLTTHNPGQIKFLSKFYTERVNLSRELNLTEIEQLTTIAHENNMLTEVFVHGSYCISFSGLCYMSSVQGRNSGNRGRCSQPCRDEYIETLMGNKFPLNLKDNSAFFDLKEILLANVDSLKIEGRIKKFHYVYLIVESYKKQLYNLFNKNSLASDNSIHYKVFNRDFSNGYLKGSINRSMFIDNPRDNSSLHLAKSTGSSSAASIDRAEKELYKEKGEIRAGIKQKIDLLNVSKAPVQLIFSGNSSELLKVIIITPEHNFELLSEKALVSIGEMALNKRMLFKRFNAINNTEYTIEDIETEGLQKNVFISFNELTALKNRIIYFLNDSVETVKPVKLPYIKRINNVEIQPKLSGLIDAEKDIHLCDQEDIEIYYQLPDSINNQFNKLTKLFIENPNLIPWFPSILIGNDFDAAVEFLKIVNPKRIVSNNTGIAYEANVLNIAWIAGPYLNVVNSYSLLCLKDSFNCSGAFISNELGKHQIKGIKKPDNFDMYYSIYHPQMLMTSRQCLFSQVVDCNKESLDNDCIKTCIKSSKITNLKNRSFFIEKSKGNLNRIFNDVNYLNTEIITDIPNVFSSYMIDLRSIQTETKIDNDKTEMINLFKELINGNPSCRLESVIYPSGIGQYRKGI